MSLGSLKNRFLDNNRQQKSVIMANFGTTDMDIEIRMQPDSHLDAAKAKKAGSVTIPCRTSQYSQSDTIQKRIKDIQTQYNNVRLVLYLKTNLG